jgi:hypothetical protein
MGVNIGRTARHRHHRRHLRKTQSGASTGETGNEKGQDNRWPRHIRRDLTCHDINAEPNDCANTQHGEAHRPEAAAHLSPALRAGLRLKAGNRFAREKPVQTRWPLRCAARAWIDDVVVH